MSDLEKVRHYLKQRENSYAEFLKVVRNACDDVALEAGSHVVLRVYDRTDKQGGQHLKDAVKVLQACIGPVRPANLRKIADVIGVTIVVQYPDQITSTLDRLKHILSERSAKEEKRKVHNAAYFATHATYESTAVAHDGVLCEVQCKTVLHDAWSAKMHDLTYKPLGSMDRRMKGLVEAISLSLEGLEQQSQIARDMVLSRQAGERKPFQASLKAFLSGVEDSLLAGSSNDTDVAALRSDVKDFEAGGGAEVASDQAAELNPRIRAALETKEQAGEAWLVAVRFASALPSMEGNRFLSNAADGLFEDLAELRDRDLISEPQLRAIPIGFYTLQDFGRAIEYVDKLLTQASVLSLTEETMRILKFNKATWLLESESLRPSKPEAAQSIKDEVLVLLEDVRPTLTDKDLAVVQDTDGLLLIVYGTTKEEVRAGIDLCMKAGEPVEGDELETAVALAYAEWRNHVGWRRYFELAEADAG